MSQDVLDKTGREARLQAAEERLHLAEMASGIGTFDLDLNSGQWEWSRQLAVLFGLDPQNASSSFADWGKVIFPDDLPKVHDALASARHVGAYHAEFRVRHPDGTVHWLSGRGALIPENGSPQPRLRGAYYEITDRKVLEAKLLAANETLEGLVAEGARKLAVSVTRLEETERRFRLLVEAVVDYAIFMLDPDGIVVSWNPGAHRIKGYTSDEIIGEHFSRFYTSKDQENGVPAQTLATAKRTGKYEADVWRVRKDGSIFWASVVLNAIYDSTGALLGFAKITRDLTEKRASEQRLHRAQRVEALGQLTGGIAHDFNNLLTVIIGNIEALRRRLPEATPNLRRFANSAIHGAERASVLVHRLLAFSRRQSLAPKALSVNTLIAGVSDMLRRTLGETIFVETVLSGDIWPIFADVAQLESALLNLAINARDAMPAGGRLTFEAANAFLDEKYAANAEIAPGQYVGIFVSDTGMGMTPETASQAFDPFFTTKEPGRGTGLGLSQVYGFIKQSGGHVKIYSEVGLGTTVKLYLPRYLDADAPVEVPAAMPAAPRGHGEAILVVEDDADVRSFTVETLRDLGYRVIEATDGAEGLQRLDAHRDVLLLLTDVGLPGGMDGRQLADEARRRLGHLKVLFTSGYARHAIVHHGRLDRDVEFLAKPFAYSTLAQRIRGLLDAR